MRRGRERAREEGIGGRRGDMEVGRGWEGAGGEGNPSEAWLVLIAGFMVKITTKYIK